MTANPQINATVYHVNRDGDLDTYTVVKVGETWFNAHDGKGDVPFIVRVNASSPDWFDDRVEAAARIVEIAKQREDICRAALVSAEARVQHAAEVLAGSVGAETAPDALDRHTTGTALAKRLWAPWLAWEQGMCGRFSNGQTFVVLMGDAAGRVPLKWHTEDGENRHYVLPPSVSQQVWIAALPDPSHVGTLALIADQVHSKREALYEAWTVERSNDHNEVAAASDDTWDRWRGAYQDGEDRAEALALAVEALTVWIDALEGSP